MFDVRCRLLLLASLSLGVTSVHAPEDPPHWSLVRPERPAVPVVRDSGWPENPIDRFVLARLEREGLRPSPLADRATLIRRVSLDLLGLPPEPDAVDAFLADQRPDAYERLVDSLLASPHFGERMAQHWLDLARYADTNGYLFDTHREMWPWRDWVIDAFNANVPFDRFTVEQLAGDLLPDATPSQRIATGFHRNHAVTRDDLGQPGEYAHRYVADRVNTTASVWLGLTVGCAECHDHEYDPISQRDYYRLYALFERGPTRGVVPPQNPAPSLRLPSAELGVQVCELQTRIDRLRARIDATEADVRVAQQRWERQLRADPPAAPTAGLAAHFTLDANAPGVAELGGIGRARWVAGVRGRALWLDGKDSYVRSDDAGAFSADAAFSIGAWVRAEDDGAIVAKFDPSGFGRGYQLTLAGGRVAFRLISRFNPLQAIAAVTVSPLERHRWHHVAVTYDGSRAATGLAIYIDGDRAPARVIGAPLADDFATDSPFLIGRSAAQPYHGTVDDVRVYSRALAPSEIARLVLADVAAAMDSADPHRALLLAHYYRARVSPLTRPLIARHERLSAQRCAALASAPVVSVMTDDGAPRPTRVRIRGEFDRLGELVEPGVPAALPALGMQLTDRFALARWLVHPNHPLVGRVTVNRFWRQLFGRGLVATTDDFGTRGDLPSHPELLDWLAREFVDGGWNVKRFMRTLVCSATYRQSSRIDANALRRDPNNRVLARAARPRLDAETIRDNALAIAGVLDPRIGGPSVKPWQPAGLWREVSSNPLLSAQVYVPSPVADRYRRGLYVYLKRTAPYASFALFDAPARETCVVRRTSTTTPLQALGLLNDRVYVELARGLAQRVLAAGGDDAARLVRAFRRCVARRPSRRELELLARLLSEERQRFATAPDAAHELLAIGDLPVADHDARELAAWTCVATVLLNLDETITRG